MLQKVVPTFSLWAFKEKHLPHVNGYEIEIRLLGGLASMGKTVPSNRMALEDEKRKNDNCRD